MYYQTEYDFDARVEGQNSICLQDDFATFRLRATYEPPTGNWQASLFGWNVTDERYFNFCDGSRTGVYDYHYGRPSTWGLEFVARFGDN